VCNNTPIVKVNINEDSSEEMIVINGISSTISNSIVTYRQENGSFQTLEELMEVYGIGNATYRKIRNYVTLK
jgi:competence protein ComEA